MGDELADAMGNADLLGASRTSQQRRNTTYPGPDEDLTAWRTQVEIALSAGLVAIGPPTAIRKK